MKTRHTIALATLLIHLTGCLVSVGPFVFGAGSNARVGRSLPENPESGASYRNPVDGMELVFDGDRALYRVPELLGHYYLEGVYYRREGIGWGHSSHLDGPWRVTEEADLPHGLR